RFCSSCSRTTCSCRDRVHKANHLRSDAEAALTVVAAGATRLASITAVDGGGRASFRARRLRRALRLLVPARQRRVVGFLEFSVAPRDGGLRAQFVQILFSFGAHLHLA